MSETANIVSSDFDTCFERCHNHVIKNSVELIQVAGYKGDITRTDSRWQSLSSKFIFHYIVKDDLGFLDLSPQQFDLASTQND